MHPRRAWTDLLDDDRGSGSLEFIVGGVVLLVPLVYLIVTLGIIQQHALGVESAARHVARSVATAEDAASAGARADRILGALVDEYDIDADAVGVTVACAGDAGACPAAGRTLRVTVSSSVALPLVPPILGLDAAAAIEVESTAVQKVSRYWTDG
ncbi:TadE family protein [Microbacterium sp.]|uniref:TadE family protein n=1 Tax=Microbacterium sp. TaxID=51671 RepID=UPI0037356ADD